ncbi:MAG TPA: hypothetical protein VK629_17255, partial [Steroidobacteraceae bacterium]|nr:hypothetical protein [Steroidobacteraceae bacterium]
MHISHLRFFSALAATLCLLVGASGRSLAQDTTAVTVPDNSRARSYGGGWECNRGYRRADESCKAVQIPANAYAT